VLLATLTLLRSRASDTRIALRPAVIGTVAGAVVSAVLLILIGGRTTVYAAMLPPVMVVAFAAGALLGPAWGQALFTVVVTFVFSQLAPANVTLAGVRLTDVLLGAVIGVGAGVLAWPRGAGGELRRSSAAFLSSGGALVRDTARVLTAAAPPSAPSGPSAASASSRDGGAEGPAQPGGGHGQAVSLGAAVEAGGTIHRVEESMALADASFGMYQAERHSPDESVVDWQAVIVAGYNILRGSELLRDICTPGGLAPWRDVVVGSAARVGEACDRLASAISRGQDPRAGPVDVSVAPDSRVVDVQAWLASIADDLARVACPPTDPHTNPAKS
jgi:hypothetical protein